MKVFITGIRGFLGSHLARELAARGHTVLGSASVPGQGFPCIRVGEPVDPAVFGDSDTVVHGAHDFTPGSLELNVSGAQLLLTAAHPRRQIYLSSYSARPDAIGEYGVAKYRIENLFLDLHETVVRPGLVIGSGGLFGRTLRYLRRSPVIPLLDGGRDLVPVLAIADYATAMSNLIESGSGLVYNLFNERLPTMRELVDTVLKLDGRHALRLPIGYRLALAGLVAAERLRIPLPVGSGSLRALKLNQQCVHESNLRLVLDTETSLEEMLKQAMAVKEQRN
jgi:nucleoside-diphosphate-sugar epimerase